jgi:hypothetical protein
MRTVSDRLARDHALQPHDSKDWTHPHCCFHATIHGLTELSIFNNITMLELRTTVTEWLNTAPEPETEGGIEWWAIQRQAASTHAGIFKAQRPSQIRKQWKDHCQGYGASQGTVHTGDEIVLFAIAHIYNCKVTVHGDFLRLFYILSHRQAANYFTCMGIIDPSPPGIQTTPRLVLLLQSRRHRPRVRPGHCNEDRHRPAQAPSQKKPSPRSDPHYFHIPPHAHLHD